jgi:hypothetical protein
LDNLPEDSQIGLRIHHDEDAAVYLNGRRVARPRGFTTSYQLMPLDKEALRSLKPGQNTLAVRCRQTRGGQFIDVGLVLIEER